MSNGRPPHVLLLDDDEGLLQLARRVLQRSGYRVSAAATSEAAQAVTSTDCPDALIVDYDLKAAATGLDFFRALRAAGQTPPAILVTGFTDESRIIEALRAGIADVLPKTGDYLDFLPEAVERALAQGRLQKRLAAAELAHEGDLQYRILAETIPQLVWTCLPNGSCDFLSKQWVIYTGIAEEAQLGTAWLAVIHPEDRAQTLQAWQDAVAERAPYDLEQRLRRHDGEYRWFKSRAAPVHDRSGQVSKWFGSCTDIDDDKRADQEREALLVSERSARSEAERAVRVKDEFVTTLSHELRTPLNAIVGWAQFLLRDHGDPEKLRKGLEVIDRNAKLQAQMVDDLLDMSRIMSGKLRLEVQRVDLGDVIDNVMGSVQPAADAKEIALSVVLGSAGVVQGDPARLQQVLWNLLMNAIKFTPKQGKVTVVTIQIEGEIEIMVSDTGAGIDGDFLEHVFDRFRQQDAGTSRQYSGLGLGLSIARQLVEMHGGHISAASEGKNKGAQFFIRLPLAADKPTSRSLFAAEEPDAGLAAIEARAHGALDGLHVLVVEDEPDARDLVQRILEDSGASVAVAGNVTEALCAFGARKPDVILSDIGMPGQDGYALIRAVRSLESVGGRPTPAAALTAMAREEDRKQALMAGFQAHLAKPIDPLALLALVAALAGRS